MGRPRILIVDDERDILELLEELLVADGYDVVAAEDASTALGAIRGQLVDAAIVDLRLPGISGLELLRELRRLDPAMEVIMTTGYPELRSAIDAQRTYAFAFRPAFPVDRPSGSPCPHRQSPGPALDPESHGRSALRSGGSCSCHVSYLRIRANRGLVRCRTAEGNAHAITWTVTG